jgi:hypothetical protein
MYCSGNPPPADDRAPVRPVKEENTLIAAAFGLGFVTQGVFPLLMAPLLPLAGEGLLIGDKHDQ